MIIKACPVCRDHAKIPAPEKDLIPITSHHVNERWVIDTTYLKKYQHKNDGYRYLGVVVDHFSKRVWAFPMRTKTAVEVLSLHCHFVTILNYCYSGLSTLFYSYWNMMHLESYTAIMEVNLSIPLLKR